MPDRTQRPLIHAVWDTFGAMSAVRRYVMAGLEEAPQRNRRQGGLRVGSPRASPPPWLTGYPSPVKRLLIGRRSRGAGPAGQRSKGHRLNAWAWVATTSPAGSPTPGNRRARLPLLPPARRPAADQDKADQGSGPPLEVGLRAQEGLLRPGPAPGQAFPRVPVPNCVLVMAALAACAVTAATSADAGHRGTAPSAPRTDTARGRLV